MIVVALCAAMITAAMLNLRCMDAAREAVRLAARDDTAQAGQAARRIAPEHAQIEVHPEGDYLVATVTAHAPLLPMLEIRAEAVAVHEPVAR